MNMPTNEYPSLTYTVNPIGFIQSPYKEKFAVPRQPNLVKQGTGFLTLISPYNDINCVKGLEQFSHIWIMFIFHQISGWQPTVRPPRLGGNQRIGVFATRSMFRPNPIGLSLVELLDIQQKKGEVILSLGSLDLVDGTPVIDIKPYLPFADSQPYAQAGYAQQAPSAPLKVIFSQQSEYFLKTINAHYPNLRLLITEVLAQDPRPAYHANKQANRQYAFSLYDFNIRWIIAEDGCATVIDIERYKHNR